MKKSEPARFGKLFLWVMRIHAIIVILICSTNLLVLGNTYAQSPLDKKVSIDLKAEPLKNALEKVSKVSGVKFLYSDDVAKSEIKITYRAKLVTVSEVLNAVLGNYPFSYVSVEKDVLIKYDPAKLKKQAVSEKPKISSALIKITGKVTDEAGNPLPGVNIKVKDAAIATVTNADGLYSINADPNAVLQFSYIGYHKTEVAVNGRAQVDMVLAEEKSALDEVKVIGYGTTTKRANTGSISTLSSSQIEEQPVTNVLSALSGRMAGVFVQTTNGLPGGNINIQIRGKGSITAGTNPLYIIDGVPFGSTIGGTYTSTGILATGSVNGTVSPLNSLNPDDIESITILKDADATSIYGSRGTNGVVLITTKSGKAGKTKVTLNINEGINMAASIPKMMDLQQYLEIRKEAFVNKGAIPSNDPTSANYAPDLTIWSQTNGTDWAKYLLGGKGHVTDGQVNLSGGSNQTTFSLGGNFHSETTYLPGDNLYQRGGIHFSMHHTSLDGRFYVQFSNSLVLDNNRLTNLTTDNSDILLPPNYPIYDALGNYNWNNGANPIAESNAVSKATTVNTVNNVLLQYSFIKDLKIKVSAGYNQIGLDQTQIYPTSALNIGKTNYSNFGSNSNNILILEPQSEYNHKYGKVNFDLLIGGTYQHSISKGNQIVASNFSSESLMNNFSSAASYTLSNSYSDYKYISAFGRATINYNGKYFLNATIRRDGSSAFGPSNQFGNFGWRF